LARFNFTPGEELESTKAAPVVATEADQNKHTALNRLVGEEEQPRGGARMRTDLSSELISPPSSDKDSDSEKEEEEEEEEEDEDGGKSNNGRPNFRREKVDAEALKSDRECFDREGKRTLGHQLRELGNRGWRGKGQCDSS
jgi:hypothetical protein